MPKPQRKVKCLRKMHTLLLFITTSIAITVTIIVRAHTNSRVKHRAQQSILWHLDRPERLLPCGHYRGHIRQEILEMPDGLVHIKLLHLEDFVERLHRWPSVGWRSSCSNCVEISLRDLIIQRQNICTENLQQR